MKTTDVLIVGCGVIGLTIARELNLRYPDLKIILIEKEKTLGCHASGRNSGVVHAGFYYSPDSLKAKFTVEGNRLLTSYCLENGIDILRNGKVVVTKGESELPGLYELKKRGDQNGVLLDLVDEKELEELEPNARTFQKALYSPTTSSVSPGTVLAHIENSLTVKKNIFFLLREAFLRRKNKRTIQTRNGTDIKFKYLVNTAGLYADKISHQFGVGKQYSLLPFKGLYLEYRDCSLINKHVYPVPDLKYPFLGVHFTKTLEGEVKIGPTAVPALWRESYGGLSNFKSRELMEILSIQLRLYFGNANNFRKVASEEIKKTGKNNLFNQAALLVRKSDKSKLGHYLKSGIRAQLYDRNKKKMEMDFVVEHGENSTHVLNAVSPAFTCAFSFSKFVVDQISSRL